MKTAVFACSARSSFTAALAKDDDNHSSKTVYEPMQTVAIAAVGTP